MKRSLWIVAALVVSLAAQAHANQTFIPTPVAPLPGTNSPAVMGRASKTLPPVSTTIKREKVDMYSPLKLRAPVPTDKVYYVDGMSSQPWARMAGSHPGWSEFPRPETANRGLDIFSLSFR